MPISPTLRERLTRSIGAILPQNDDIKRIVENATGLDCYNDCTNPMMPRAQQISQILQYLEKAGNERWLLTYVLVQAAADDKLRRLIVSACPQTMDASTPMDRLVDDVVQHFEQALGSRLPQDIKMELREKRGDFDAVLRQNVELLCYKRMQELLLRLHTRLTFGITVEPLNDVEDRKESVKQVMEACKQARDVAALLGLPPDKHASLLSAIAEFEQAGGDVSLAIERGDPAGVEKALGALNRLIRQNLSRLNGHVFELAKRLPLAAMIIEQPPLSVEESPLNQSVRNLAPTVLARVLLRKIWQDVINEIALVTELLNAGVTGGTEFGDHWYTLKSRAHWLSELEPEAPWSKCLNECSADLDTQLQLAVEKGQGDIRSSFANYRRAVGMGFSAVMLKLDFEPLEKINPKLKAVLEEISHV